ncbi:hypothetical protein [Methylobacterium sp. P1-11]|uniref:hypothetical protein n=1 Tax=Methylobacterium sp. P1-11 TaxID=2024616 RepID=UPI0032B12CE2
MADALVDTFDGNIATKADIRDVQADIQVVRCDIEALKGATASAKVETKRWLVGAIGFQTWRFWARSSPRPAPCTEPHPTNSAAA